MQYVVRALDSAQQIHTLVLDAFDERDAKEQARARMLMPLSIARRGGIALGRRAERFDLVLFAQELSALLAAGLSVIESLEALVEKDAHAARKAILTRLAEQLRQGQRLSSALRQHPAVFPPLLVGIVQAAEGTSDLPRALSRYLEYETRLRSVRHKVTSAAIYPAILVVVGLAVALFLLGYVVPRFAAVYQGSGRPLPWASEMLLAWGQFASAHAAWLAGAIVAVTALIVGWFRHSGGSGSWLRVIALLPGARTKIEVLQLSRLYLTLGMLIEGGIPVVHALKLSEAVLGGSRADLLLKVREQVESGHPLSEALSQQGLTTPVAVRLMRVGEQSGRLGQMLERAAQFHDDETSRWIERFSKAFEPVLMAAIGLVIGLIVILLYMPIFDLAGTLG